MVKILVEQGHRTIGRTKEQEQRTRTKNKNKEQEQRTRTKNKNKEQRTRTKNKNKEQEQRTRTKNKNEEQEQPDEQEHEHVWVPEILAREFRKFWPPARWTGVRWGRRVRGVWCASTGRPG
jgi:hypothetical protein